jgi:bifunctional non-homologous end joining protein LigD
VKLVEVDGRRLALTNLDKVLFPQGGFTKGELITYYAETAPVLLPHLAGKPVTTRRFPDGVDGVSWHQNECSGEPNWFPVFCLVDGPASLLWLVNRAAIEFHPFLWRVELPREPLSLVLDLDPGPPAGLLEAARVALRLRQLLEELGLAALVKTSGSLGLHLHVPLERPSQTKELARGTAQALAERHPDEVVAEMAREKRAGKVYVDWLQNDPTRQTVAPYSLRGLAWPTVAAPLRWEEVEEAVAKGRPEQLTILAQDVAERLERHGDLFEPLLAAERRLDVTGRKSSGSPSPSAAEIRLWPPPS